MLIEAICFLGAIGSSAIPGSSNGLCAAIFFGLQAFRGFDRLRGQKRIFAAIPVPMGSGAKPGMAHRAHALSAFWFALLLFAIASGKWVRANFAAPYLG